MKSFARILFFFSALIFASCAPSDQVVTWGSSFSWRQLLNVHESPKRWIAIAGSRYYYPRGVAPFYLDIPKINGIFFVTEDRPGTDFKCHFFLLKERREIVFQMQSGYLGGGVSEPRNASFSDWIETVDWPVVTVMHKADAKITAFDFNLQNGTVATRAAPTHKP